MPSYTYPHKCVCPPTLRSRLCVLSIFNALAGISTNISKAFTIVELVEFWLRFGLYSSAAFEFDSELQQSAFKDSIEKTSNSSTNRYCMITCTQGVEVNKYSRRTTGSKLFFQFFVVELQWVPSNIEVCAFFWTPTVVVHDWKTCFLMSFSTACVGSQNY